jgi:SAM-dependent methyltransferase
MKSITQLSHRDQLGDWLTHAGLIGTGVEVGTFRGEYAALLAETWAGHLLHTCDPWEHYEGYRDGCVLDHHKPGRPKLDLEVLRQEATARLAPFGGKVQVHQCKGIELIAEFGPLALDFVYLDGAHDHATVMRELQAAWGVVRPGGIVASHDYYNRQDSLQDCGVESAIKEFSAMIGVSPHITACTSAWLQKPL